MTWLQHWEDVLFVHVPVGPDDMRPWLPRGLDLDCYAGQAYIGLVGFRLTLRPAWLPRVPGFSSLLELNVRTYVRYRDRPGIIFLRMYADNRLAVAASRLLTPLCYETAAMDAGCALGRRRFTCRPRAAAERFCSEFEPAEPYRAPQDGSLAAWLVERYTLFVAARSGLLAATVDHLPWEVAEVDPQSIDETISRRFARPRGKLLAHHSRKVAATFRRFVRVAEPLERIGGGYSAERAHSAALPVLMPKSRAAIRSSNL